MNASRVWWHEWLLVNLSVNETKRCVRIPIKATAREPIKQAGYISATSAFHAQSLLRNAAGPYIRAMNGSSRFIRLPRQRGLAMSPVFRGRAFLLS
jgi:hypothetical protein